MSRTDLHEAIEAAWAENDQLRNDLAEKVQELEEANAVIDAVRKARDKIADRKRIHYHQWNETDTEAEAARCAAYDAALGLLNAVDGL